VAELASVTGRRITVLENWQLALATPGQANPPGGDWIAAPVPGTAAQALRNAGRWNLEPPMPLHDKDVWYQTRFAGTGRQTLRFEGLATIAEVRLNGTPILASDNMFLSHEVDVELAGDNELVVVFRSLDRELGTRKAGRARWRTRLVENNALRLVRTTLLGHMTGWQPPAHVVGPWRGIQLIEQAPTHRVHRALLRSSLENDDGVLVVDVSLDWKGARPEPILEAGETNGRLAWVDDSTVSGTLRLPNVEKWWPHTHGEPTLYAVKLRLGDIEIDLGRTGFRSLELDRGADGCGFALKVNGVSVFARGACWSASDLATLRGDRAAVAPWLMAMRDAHMNMVRVGGTMTYESDGFFALCDELGLLVWHDFMLANMDYPTEALRGTLEAEAAQFLRRTEAHPSLAVLCGGSEVAQQVSMLGMPPALWTSELYEQHLPNAVAACRPDVPYVAHSPGGGDLPFATDVGVSHYYGVGAYRRPLEDARRAGVRFTSECLAFANVPCHATAAPVWVDPERWKTAIPRDRGAEWDFEDVRDHYVALLYGVDPARLRADDPKRYLRLGRAASAEVMESTIAEWRRAGSSCHGALVWMLKDFVPGAGWGVIDALGRPKLAWHALRRAFRPIQVALTDEGLNGLGIHLINETAVPIRARLSLTCLLGGETVVMKREREVELPARSTQVLSSAAVIGSFFDITAAYRFGPPALDCSVVRLSDAANGAVLSEAAHFPLGRAALTPAAGLAAELVRGGAGWMLHLTTRRLAPCIQIEDPHHWASDEGFFLLPGEERRVRFMPAGDTAARPSGAVAAGYGGEEAPY
jgi:beta-mannosidase